MEQRPDILIAIESARFIASSFDFYTAVNDKLEVSITNERFLVFFSRPFLRKKGWSVIPLWEGNMCTLLRDDRTVIPFMDSLRTRCLETGGHYMYAAGLIEHRVKWQMDPAASVLSLACRKFDLISQNPEDIFESTPHHIPNFGGNNFLWPSNERFIIYTDMDNASFIAGDRNEILDTLGYSYEYCIQRIKRVHEGKIRPNVLKAWLNFCDEFA